jgi:hypothetical protein
MPRKKTNNPEILKASNTLVPKLSRDSVQANFSEFPTDDVSLASFIKRGCNDLPMEIL